MDAKSLSREDVDWSLAKEIDEESKEITEETLFPEKFALHPVYPNPFNLSTTIMFDLPEASKIELKIYDILGREVWSWPQNNSELPDGNHRIIWNVLNRSDNVLPSGVYFIKFWSDQFQATQKVI